MFLLSTSFLSRCSFLSRDTSTTYGFTSSRATRHIGPSAHRHRNLGPARSTCFPIRATPHRYRDRYRSPRHADRTNAVPEPEPNAERAAPAAPAGARCSARRRSDSHTHTQSRPRAHRIPKFATTVSMRSCEAETESHPRTGEHCADSEYNTHTHTLTHK